MIEATTTPETRDAFAAAHAARGQALADIFTTLKVFVMFLFHRPSAAAALAR